MKTGVFLSAPRYDWCAPLSHPSSCMLVNHGPSSRAPKKNTSHGNEVLPQDTTHFIQRPCHQWGSPCQDPAGNWTTWSPPDHPKETQTKVVWTCLLFIRSGQNHLARHSESGKNSRQMVEEGWEDSFREWRGLEFASPRGQLWTEKNRENWLWSHLWCPNSPAVEV